jgi:hypothetical protein
MRRGLLLSLPLVAAVAIAGAFALGVFTPTAGVDDATAVADAQAPAVEPASPPAVASPARPDAAARRSEGAPSASAAREPAAPAAPTTGTLRVDSDMAGADVFIDNRFVGKTPATLYDLPPGTHKISVSAPGHETVTQFHDVVAGRATLTIPIAVVRLDRTIAVAHKHRIGSCEGRLIATPAGLRYETDRTEDAFSAALTALESFEADYLQKNLKVAVRGKTYNFTDPSGDAADLYQFYQDVEKVRQRLLKDGGADGA